MKNTRWIALVFGLLGSLAQGAEVPPPEGMQKTFDDLNEALSKSRMVPKIENGEVTGYQRVDVPPAEGKVGVKRLGIENGETLTVPQGSAPADSSSGTE